MGILLVGLLFAAICSHLAEWGISVEVLPGREIISLMLYIGNCTMHVSSSSVKRKDERNG